MPLALTWADVGLRIVLTILAAAAIGYDRDVEGHAAGLRTVILVALAASLAMVQANWLMDTVGKSSSSFAVLDLMRLPLGILTGVGFIGGGAILRKGDLITGVTTAATLWLVTVIGLCLGGGQLLLGIAATALAVLTLSTLKWVDGVIPREHRARLVVTCEANWEVLEGLPNMVKPLKYHAHFRERKCHAESDQADYTFELSWHRPDRAFPPVDLLRELNKNFQVTCFEVTTDP